MEHRVRISNFGLRIANLKDRGQKSEGSKEGGSPYPPARKWAGTEIGPTKIRNPKHEARNKFKCLKSQIQNRETKKILSLANWQPGESKGIEIRSNNVLII